MASTSWKGMRTSSRLTAYAVGGKKQLLRCLNSTLRARMPAITILLHAVHALLQVYCTCYDTGVPRHCTAGLELPCKR